MGLLPFALNFQNRLRRSHYPGFGGLGSKVIRGFKASVDASSGCVRILLLTDRCKVPMPMLEKRA